MARATWLPDVLRAAGLDVTVDDDFWSLGSSAFYPSWQIFHHTASVAGSGDMPAYGTVRYGRPDVPPPLCNILVGRSGRTACIASGRANHGGAGVYFDGTSGNSLSIGWECENNGTGEPWPEVQLGVIAAGMAVVAVRLVDPRAERIMYHREYARPVGRKPDPAGPGIPQDGGVWRATVRSIIETGGGLMPLTKEDLFAIGVTIKKCLDDVEVATDADVAKAAEQLKAQAKRHNQGAQDRHAETLDVLERIAAKLGA